MTESDLADRLIANLLFPKMGEDPIPPLIADVASLSQDRLAALDDALAAVMMETAAAPRPPATKLTRHEATEVMADLEHAEAAGLILLGPVRAFARGFSAKDVEPWLRKALPLTMRGYRSGDMTR